jgi:polyhydroxyalkanoate synthase
MYLNNDLAMGRYKLDSRPIDLSDIKAPIFALAAKQDFVAPWRSVYKLHQYVHGDIEFVLTSGGHNAGIINPPASKKHSSFQHLKRSSGNESLNAQVWLEKAPIESGSWWPYWLNWLNEHSDSQLDTPIYLGAANSQMNTLGPAPGTYVLH